MTGYCPACGQAGCNDIDSDAKRYRAMREIALNPSLGLEAFVALNQLDFVSNAAEFDEAVDTAIAKLLEVKC